MDLSEYLSLSDGIAASRTREDVLKLVRRISAADMEPLERRTLARKLAAAAQAIDPALAIELLPDLLPRR